MQIHIYIRTQSIHKVIDLHLDVDAHSRNDDALSLSRSRSRSTPPTLAGMGARNQVERIRTKVTKHLIILTIRVPFYFNWITPKTMFRFGAHLLNAASASVAAIFVVVDTVVVVVSNVATVGDAAVVVASCIHFRLIISPWLWFASKGKHCRLSTAWTESASIIIEMAKLKL